MRKQSIPGRLSPPTQPGYEAKAPPTFCTEAKVAKGGAFLRDTTVYVATDSLMGSVHGQRFIHFLQPFLT